MSVLESIVKDLEALPEPKLVEVAHFVSRLNPQRREERLAALKFTAGCLGEEEGLAFEKAVIEEGDRIDLDEGAGQISSGRSPKGIPPNSPGLRGTSYPGYRIRRP